MARFLLVDHSVTGPGGHNFEHANDMLHAAEALGYEPVLAANQAAAATDSFPPTWRILPLFPDSWDPLHWIGPDGRSFHPADIDGKLLAPSPVLPTGLVSRIAYRHSRVRDALRHRDRRWRICRFADACADMWSLVRPRADDRIFFPSVTEFDLLGLVRFLKSEPESRCVDWHLMFHFNLFTGRTPSYEKQELTRDRFRRLFASALSHVAEHRMHFYGVTDLCADQYNRLGTVHFSELPYTISGSIQANAQTERERPIRLTCPGVIRREKGKRQIKNLVRHLWKEHLESGGAQLCFQGKPKDFRRFFPKETLQHSSFSESPITSTTAPIVIVRHPLSPPDYAALIRNSQVGLFLHDSERYFSRCSGTLVELLGAGVPVIVPAGCWLAEQVAEPVCAHLDQLVTSDAVIHRCGGLDQWDVPRRLAHETAPSEGLTFGRKARASTCKVSVPENAADVVCSFRLMPEIGPGQYVRVEADQYDAGGTLLSERQVSIIGARREASKNASVFFSLHPNAVGLHLVMSNAYDSAQLTTSDPQIAFLGRHGHPAGSPGGQVGLIAADLSQYSRLVRDISTHYAHYRLTAAEYARDWARDHSAFTVIERLDGANRTTRDAKLREAAA